MGTVARGAGGSDESRKKGPAGSMIGEARRARGSQIGVLESGENVVRPVRLGRLGR